MFNIKQFLGLTYYISPPDRFLAEINKKYHQPTASQQAEITKYERISKLRDHKVSDQAHQTFWDKF